MANIKDRLNKDGTISFEISVYLGRDENKKKILKYTTFTAKSKAITKAWKEAQTFARDYETRLLAGDIPADENITFAQFTEIWKKNWLIAKTPGVQQNYKDILRVHVIPSIGNMKLVAIRAPHIDAILKRKKNGKEQAPATIRKTFTVINSVFKYALKKQYVRENPCTRCDDLPTIVSKTGNDLSFFTEDQTRRFLKDALTMKYDYTIKSHYRVLAKTGERYYVPSYTESRNVPLQWQIYFTMAIYGQMRRGEMCALTWNDINFEKHIISINKSAREVKTLGRIVKEPKTKAGIRDLVMPADLFDLLKKWKKEQTELCISLGTAWQGHRTTTNVDGMKDHFDENTLFIRMDNGLPIDLSTPYHKFEEIISYYNQKCTKEEDKLPQIRLHDLRHTGATLLLGKNTDIETVSRRLGHSKASVTLDIYGHALPENDKKAAETIATMFGS